MYIFKEIIFTYCNRLEYKTQVTAPMILYIFEIALFYN